MNKNSIQDPNLSRNEEHLNSLPTTMTWMSPRTGTLFWSFECFWTPPNNANVIPAVDKAEAN